MKPRLLDLFCGAGGAAVGYSRAGFELVGVDIKLQSNYPFKFIEADALEVLAEGLELQFEPWRFDAIHASPPCQAHTTLRFRTKGAYPDLIKATRELLIETGLPYVIENVVGAPLIDPVMLCGSTFGLEVEGRELRRHRLFETSFPVFVASCQHDQEVVGVYGTGGGGQMTRGYKARGVKEAREALETPWMTLAECAQAIPPAYTELIGHQLLAHIRAEAAA